jgi:glutamate racemase
LILAKLYLIRSIYYIFMQSGFIEIFDSGVGGLAVYRAARKLLPHQAFVYVADSRFAPYGSRESAYITRRATEIADALVNNGAKALVVACNTATVTTVTALRARYSLPIIGIEPAIKPATAVSRNGRIVVLTTQRTAESADVAQLCVRYGTHVQIMLQPCPGLADQVEAGNIDGKEVKKMLRQYLAPAVSLTSDVVVLGCTHFTFLADQIQNLAGPQVTIIEPSEAVARFSIEFVMVRTSPQRFDSVLSIEVWCGFRPHHQHRRPTLHPIGFFRLLSRVYAGSCGFLRTSRTQVIP